MSENVKHLAEAISAKLQYFMKEYDITVAEAVGVLEVAKHVLIRGAEDE